MIDPRVGVFVSDTARHHLDAKEVVAVLEAEIAERQDAIGTSQKVGRIDLVERMSAEIEILSLYL